MAVAPKKPKPAKIRRGLEWTTIPVWYVYTGGLAVALVVGIGGFLAYQAIFGAQKKAQRAVAIAQSKYQQAAGVAKPVTHDKFLKAAEAKLGEAQAAADQKQWDLALVAAKESIENSQEILNDIGEGSTQVASFKRMSGTVEVKKANSTQWITASADTVLGPNDLVKTDPSSRAEIVYANNTRITVDPNSLIQIVRPELTEVNAGTTQVTTGRINHSVQTSDGTEVTVAPESRTKIDVAPETGATDVGVAAGEAKVKRGSEEVRLAQGEGVETGPAGIGAVKKLPEIPRTPDNLQLFEYDTGATSMVTIRWEPVAEAVKYRVETGSDPLLSGSSTQRIEVTKNALELQGYPDGDYYWRVTALDTAGKASIPSPVQAFRIGRKGQTSADQAPIPVPSLAIDTITTLGSTVILKGRTDPPPTTITVDGEAVEVKADGTWHSVTPLREDGRNVVVVMARNAEGGARRTRVVVWAEVF